jgi:hypothetical protein
MFTRSNFAKVARPPEIVLTMSFVGILLAYISAATASPDYSAAPGR